ncbi:Phosphoribosyl-ATP pyrophosphatase [Candidatus Hodgkinia cicadicola]|uniref:phosphoribosyl-ATP diphosphatase n=1 Tax=Candidatus Hodgkinia cicadicola TaxID=573658 RepID=A0ABX4MH84_9HYPH|nr:Phosphoribosyl-ATP pyrophosphatase [Candidatus Hodgkinia cicadicola]
MSNIVVCWQGSYCSWDLRRIIFLIHNKSRILSDSRSWTTKLLSAGTKFILKKIGEEQTELLLAHCFESNHEVIMESVDLIYHIVLLTRSIGLNSNYILKLIDIPSTWANKHNLNKLIKFSHILNYKWRTDCSLTINKELINVPNSLTLKRLNNEILNLIMIVVKLGTKELQNNIRLNELVVNIIYNVMGLVRDKGIEYWIISTEIVNRTSK